MNKKILILPLLISIVIVALDYFAKDYIYSIFLLKGYFSIFILPVLNIVIVFNSGVSFGILSHLGAYLHLFLSLCALLIFCTFIYTQKGLNIKAKMIILGFIIGGSIGNMIDRIKYGAVVDYIDLHLGLWHFPSFNIADACITLSAIIAIICLYRVRGK